MSTNSFFRSTSAEASIDVDEEEETNNELNELTPDSAIQMRRVKGFSAANKIVYNNFINYEKEKERWMKCKLCDEYDVRFPAKTSCEKLKKHLENKHSQNAPQKRQALILQSESGDLTARNTSSYTHQKLRLAVDEFIILDEQPFSIVEKKGFKNVIQVARPEYIQVGRKTVKKDIVETIYPAYKECIKEILSKEVEKKTTFAFTTDVWTCSSQSKGNINTFTCTGFYSQPMYRNTYSMYIHDSHFL